MQIIKIFDSISSFLLNPRKNIQTPWIGKVALVANCIFGVATAGIFHASSYLWSKYRHIKKEDQTGTVKKADEVAQNHLSEQQLTDSIPKLDGRPMSGERASAAATPLDDSAILFNTEADDPLWVPPSVSTQKGPFLGFGLLDSLLPLNSSAATAIPVEEEVSPSEIAAQQPIIQGWLTAHQDDFIGHAIWPNQFKEIMQDDNPMILPTEAILRKKGEVMTGYGIVKLPKLTEEDLQSLEVLDDKFQPEYDKLMALKASETLSPSELMELKVLQKKSKDDLGNSEKTRLAELEPKARLTKEERKVLTYFSRRKQGVLCWFNKKTGKLTDSFNVRREDVCNNIAKKLKEAGFATPKGFVALRDLILMAFDISRERPTDKYLQHIFKKVQEGKLEIKERPFETAKTRHISLGIDILQLSSQLRVMKEDILSVARQNFTLLRGKTKDIMGRKFKELEDCSDDVMDYIRAPYENDGEFLGLPLAQEDTLLLASRKNLAPYEARLKELNIRYAFLECLTDEQQALLKVSKAYV